VAAGTVPEGSPAPGASKAYGTTQRRAQVAENPNDENIANLRKLAEEGKAAIERAALLEKQVLFARAGIDTDTKIGKMLFATWEGGDDITALKAEAIEIGAIRPGLPEGQQPQQPAQQRGATPEDAGQQQFRQQFAGAPAAGSVDDKGPDPYESALSEFYDSVNKGAQRRQAGQSAIAKILAHASQGDERVLFDPDRWRAEQAAAGRG
jgi:hypothetical protein